MVERILLKSLERTSVLSFSPLKKTDTLGRKQENNGKE